MQLQNLRKSIFGIVVVSEMGHLFCCVLPAVFSIIGLLFGLGVLPAWIIGMHDLIHEWELPIIGFSALMLIFGWGMLYLSCKNDCKEGACGHQPEHQKKSWSFKILVIASVLFLFNLSVYYFVHYEPHSHDDSYAHYAHDH